MPSNKDHSSNQPRDAGMYLGSEPELAQETIPGGLRDDDERVAGEATQSTGPGGRAANPDEGWQDGPEGHREGRAAGDDLIRRKG
jgi:hypothetical protein